MSYKDLSNALAPLFGPAGFELVVDHFDDGAFGSGFSEYRRGELRVRFVWDGRDGSARIECSRSQAGGWEDLERLSPRAIVERQPGDSDDRFLDLRSVAAHWLAAHPVPPN